MGSWRAQYPRKEETVQTPVSDRGSKILMSAETIYLGAVLNVNLRYILYLKHVKSTAASSFWERMQRSVGKKREGQVKSQASFLLADTNLHLLSKSQLLTRIVSK